jgi:hypothetical protein
LIKQILTKWFGLEPELCESCETLRQQLYESNMERKDLLNRLLNGNQSEPQQSEKAEELTPITPAYVPWQTRKRLLEAEDKKAAAILRKKQEEIDQLKVEEQKNPVTVDPTIAELEKELQIEAK